MRGVPGKWGPTIFMPWSAFSFVSGCGKFAGRRKEIMCIISVPQLVHYVTACRLVVDAAPATWRALFDRVVPFKSGEAVTHTSVHIMEEPAEMQGNLG